MKKLTFRNEEGVACLKGWEGTVNMYETQAVVLVNAIEKLALYEEEQADCGNCKHADKPGDMEPCASCGYGDGGTVYANNWESGEEDTKDA